MNIVIVGTGSTGWILANYLKRIEYIKKITIIGSSKIPSIGVGESTTLFFKRFLDELIESEDFTLKDFIKNTDAAVKYGVYYKNWSSKDFLHHFKNDKTFYSVFDKIYYGRLLANKDSETYIHDLLGRDIFDMTQENLIYKNENDHPITYHFDAAKFIDFFSKIMKQNY
jgi:tryptophan halogenase